MIKSAGINKQVNSIKLKKIQLKNNGQFTKKDLEYFGGKYNFIQRFKMNGIGSSKVIYKSGVPYFDELSDFVENETAYANFELLKNGLLIRLNRNQHTRIVGFQLREVLNIEINSDTQKNGIASHNLTIKTLNNGVLRFDVLIQNVKMIKHFFSKRIFSEKLQSTSVD